MAGVPQGVCETRGRKLRGVATAALISAAAVPALLWHDIVLDIASQWQLELEYATGWTPWVLMSLGVLFFIPVVVSAGRDPDSRLFVPARNAYASWGVTLYMLGFGIATQVAQLSRGAAG